MKTLLTKALAQLAKSKKFRKAYSAALTTTGGIIFTALAAGALTGGVAVAALGAGGLAFLAVYKVKNEG